MKKQQSVLLFVFLLGVLAAQSQVEVAGIFADNRVLNVMLRFLFGGSRC